MQRMRIILLVVTSVGAMLFPACLNATGITDPTAVNPILTISESTPAFIRVEAKVPQEAFDSSIDPENSPQIPGLSTITQPGKPEIPVVTRCLLIPPTGGVRLAEVHSDSRLLRNLRSTATEFDENIVTQTDLEADADGFWPAQQIILGEPAILRGYRIVTVTMFPEQINLNTGEVRRHDAFDFQLEFSGPEINPVLGPQNNRYSAFAARAVRQLVDNPPPLRDDELSGSYLYIVPNHQGALNEIAPLIEWRKRQGHDVTLQVVANDIQQAGVMGIIRNAYQSDNSVEFVTLVGDASRGDFNIPPSSQQGDWNYTLQEGNDALSDLAIGRLSCRNSGELRTIVHKLVTYESDPFDGNEDWYLQGGVVAGSSLNGISEVFVAKYVRRELYNLGFTEVRGYFWPEQGNANGNQPFLTDWFRWGISVLHYRAFQLMNNLPTDVIDNLPFVDGRWPAVLAISCETGNFTAATDGHTEHFLRARGGAVGAIGTATPNTNVKYNNLVAGGVWKGTYKDGLYTFGWGLNSGKYELWRSFSGLDNNYLSFLEWNNLMGDAGTHLWTGLPTRIDVEHSATIALGQSAYSVYVADADSGDPVDGALVCLYKGDEVHEVAYTENNGNANFHLAPDAMTQGDLLITVTKHNVRPYLDTINVIQPRNFLGVDEWHFEDESGDGTLNPAENATLVFTVMNFGDEQPDGRFSVIIYSESDRVEIEDDTTLIDEVPEPGSSIEIEHSFRLKNDCSDGVALPFMFLIQNNDQIWTSRIEMSCSAPLITVESTQIEGGQINPGEIKNISLMLGNFGSQPSEGFTATLVSHNRNITVHQERSGYIGLDVGDTDWNVGQPFRISTNDNLVPGQQFPLEIDIEFDDGTTAVASMMLMVGRPGLRDPFGPDPYGYICFDSYDTSWAIAPDFDWIEIDPNAQRRDFAGTHVNLDDDGDNRDVSTSIPLPFPFKYYGESFDTLTICTNGWAAFGDQSELADFRNTHIGQALGPVAQLCPWWDNLTTPDGSGIYIYYDEDGQRFIIEWSRLQRLLENDRLGSEETFQIILYDQDAFPTPSGDGVITFQYLTTSNDNRPAHNDIPYCTIGIGNLDDSGGLEYTYWNQYPAGARQINDRMAITFSPTLMVLTGLVRGRVTDIETGGGIPNISIRSNRRGIAVTDAAGYYELALPVGMGYALTARGTGWTDSTRSEIDIDINDTLRIDFALRHPEFSINSREIERTHLLGESEAVELRISNSGNGPLTWEAEKHVEGEGGTIGGRRFSFPAAQRAHDTGLAGVTQAGDRFYVSGSNRGGAPVIYFFNEQGALVDTFLQPGVYINPMPDLAWDGELLWGAGGRNIYGFDTEGRIQRQFIGPYAENTGIAWDPVRELLWISGSLPNHGVYGVDRGGRTFLTLSTRLFNIRGLGFWPDDPDGYPLYVFHSMLDTANVERELIHKYSLQGRSDTMFVTEFTPEEPEQARGMDISPDFSVYDWSLVVLNDDRQNNHGGDRIDVYQLGIITSWLSVRPQSGVVESGEAGQLFIDLNTAGLDSGTVSGDVIISHNAMEEQVVIPVTLHVTGLDVADHEVGLIPDEVTLLTPYPSPFNASIRIGYLLPESGLTEISVYDLHGRLMAQPVARYQQAGSHQLTLNAVDWPSGVYAIKLNAAGITRTAKTICIK